MISSEVTQRLAELRHKQLSGTITLEELREGVALMRNNRMSAAAASSGSASKKRTAAAKANINSDDLLSELEGL
jgi:hypothetical protein